MSNFIRYTLFKITINTEWINIGYGLANTPS